MLRLTILALVAATALTGAASADAFFYRHKANTFAGSGGSSSPGGGATQPGGSGQQVPSGPAAPISLVDVDKASLDSDILSNVVAVSNHPSESVRVGLSGDASARFRVCSDAACDSVVADWTESSADLANGTFVQVSLKSSSVISTSSQATLNVGSLSDTWTVKTRDAYPQVTFADLTGQPAVADVESNIVQVAGYESATVSVSGAGSPSFRVCADSSCASVVRGFASTSYVVREGQYVQMRVRTADGGTVAPRISLAGTATVWTVSSLPRPSVTMTLPSGMSVKIFGYTKMPAGVVSVTHQANTNNNSFERYKLTINTGCTDIWGFGSISEFYTYGQTTASCLAGRTREAEWTRVTGVPEYAELQFLAQGSKSTTDRVYSAGQVTWKVN